MFTTSPDSTDLQRFAARTAEGDADVEASPIRQAGRNVKVTHASFKLAAAIRICAYLLARLLNASRMSWGVSITP